ncbi:unnamed protein product [Owenia fusiformis]|uniref:Uncharacterized protein n=1 Tax=Owenia fusiformis TaxID=6347 RepID=A0A8J1Y579_OWEFU|nr:unnamed protein product [Owenia fusiformis]
MATNFDINTIEDLKYNELRKLAKDAGIKANMKADKLLKALKEYYFNQNDDTKVTLPEVESSSTEDEATEPQETTKKATKRGRGKKAAKKGRGKKSAKSDTESETEDAPKSPKVATPKAEIVTKKSTPIVKKETPITKKVTPVVTKKTIVTKTPTDKAITTPVTKKSTPVAKKTTPVTKKATPVTKKATPVTKKATPVTKKATPAPKRKRSSTKDTSVESIEHDAPVAKRQRRSTFEIKQAEPKKNSGTTKELASAMKGEMSKDEMKQSLMSALEKSVKQKGASPKNLDNAKRNIPRFAAFLASKKQEQKPVTPGNKDWGKIHAKQFEKMDSIDVYLAKKRKQTEAITASLKKANITAAQAKNTIEKIKKNKTPLKGPKIAKGVSRPMFKSPAHGGVPFVPSVTSTSNLNLNFSQLKTPAGNVSKKAPTPTRASPRVNTNTIKKVTVNEPTKENLPRKSLSHTTMRKSVGTPFKSTSKANTTTSLTNATFTAKPAFDLKASLAKPMTWKAYTGKVQPISKKTAEHKNLANKGPKIQTKEQRRAATNAHRADKKFNAQMQRRNLHV